MKKNIYKIYLNLIGFFLVKIWTLFNFVKKNDSHTVLFFADGTFESNAMMLIPVANQLNQKNIAIYFGFEYGKEKETYISNALHKLIKLVSLKNSKWIQFFSLYNNVGIKQKIGYFIYPIILLNLIFKSRPKYLLVANDIMLPSKVLVKLCKSIGVKTLSLQHGALCPPFFPIEADKLGVYSQGVKEFIVKNKFAREEQIISVGNPRWDTLKDQMKNINALEKHCVLILSQAVVYQDAQEIVDPNIEAMFDLVKVIAFTFPDIQVKIRLHPLEDQTLWDNKINFSEFDNLSFAKDEDLVAALKSSTICISGATTAFIEAALFGLKCIAYRPNIGTIAVPLETEMDYFLKIFHNSEDLLFELKNTLQNINFSNDTNNDKILDNFGHSAMYIADFIQEEIIK